MLDLDVTKTFEASFIGSVQKTEGVEEAKWWLDTKFILEGVQGGGLGSLLDRGESTGGGNKSGKDGGLHDEIFVFDEIVRLGFGFEKKKNLRVLCVEVEDV